MGWNEMEWNGIKWNGMEWNGISGKEESEDKSKWRGNNLRGGKKKYGKICSWFALQLLAFKMGSTIVPGNEKLIKNMM